MKLENINRVELHLKTWAAAEPDADGFLTLAPWFDTGMSYSTWF